MVNAFNRCYEHFPWPKILFSLSQGLTQYFLSQTLLCVTVCLFSIYISSGFGSSPFDSLHENGTLVFTCWYVQAFLAGLNISACICVFLHLWGKAAIWILLGKKSSAKGTLFIGLAIHFILVLQTKWSLSLYWFLSLTALSCWLLCNALASFDLVMQNAQ